MGNDIAPSWTDTTLDPVAASRVADLARREFDTEYLLCVLGLEDY